MLPGVAIREDVRTFLQKVAASGKTVTYSDLGITLGIPHEGKAIGKILGDISEDEVRHGRPPLSSVVVLYDSIGDAICPDGHPASGFLGCFFVPKSLPSADEEKRYMRGEQVRTWDYWKSRPPS